jgi:hypothetical protein
LKRVAIGRTNWLFAGNDRASRTAATLDSLIASPERHGVDPQRYLTSVLAKIATAPAGELERFLSGRRVGEIPTGRVEGRPCVENRASCVIDRIATQPGTSLMLGRRLPSVDSKESRSGRANLERKRKPRRGREVRDAA